MDGKTIIGFLADDKYAEAKDALRSIVNANVTSRIEAKQLELGLTVEEKKEKKTTEA